MEPRRGEAGTPLGRLQEPGSCFPGKLFLLLTISPGQWGHLVRGLVGGVRDRAERAGV